MYTTSLPPHLATLIPGGRPPYYLHQSHPMLWKGVLTAVLLLVIAALGFVMAQVWAGRADLAVWALAAFAIPFLLLLARSAVWRVPISMVADTRGLYFLYGRDSAEICSLDWRDVGTLRIERHATGHGVSRTVVLGIRADSAFWQPGHGDRLWCHHLRPVEADGYRKLPLPAVWASPARTLAALCRLKACAGS